MRLIWDIEATGLLDHTTIDYKSSPYKLKDSFKIHCIVAKDLDTGKVHKFVGDEVFNFKGLLDKATFLVCHNQLSYDLLVLKLYMGVEYEIGERSTVNGREVEVYDSLVVSKTLNPDRRPGHSIEAWGQKLGLEKIDWRAKAVELGLISSSAARGEEFKVYHPEMLVYCCRDVEVNEKVYRALEQERAGWNWGDALLLEHQVRDIITRQEHRGFWFDYNLALELIRDLDEKMEAIRVVVEPLIPPKPMGVTKLKAFLPPKIQFKKNGDMSAVMEKWIAKHGGKPHVDENGSTLVKFPDDANVWKLPMDCEVPIVTHEPAKVTDTTHIKGWLVELGWKPTQYKERDLTCDAKKNKLAREKFEAAVERYVEQTLASPFCKDRCSELDTTRRGLRDKLLKHDIKRPLKVYTNPTLTVGMDKDIDPNLVEFAKSSDKFQHAKLVSEYLTYSHRRNSILGGGTDPDEFDEDDEYAGKGYIAVERIQEDGRIPTPADTCGAGTSRFKHRLCANIPRVTSLYGSNMRALFGVDKLAGMIQMGYDFDSLEARIEAHYVFKYEGGPEYGVSLTAEKPNDCHTVLADSITKLLGRPFPRGTAKNVKYGCSYNAQVARVAKTVGCTLEEAQVIFDAFWLQAAPLKELKERMQKYWETTGEKKFLMGIDNRKLPIRSKGNVINTAFQSAGVICAKRAMVIHEKMLKEAGLYVDFFRDDWQNKVFCQQLIAYHDEAQLELHRSLVKFKTFPVNGEWTVEKDGKTEPSDEAKAAEKAAKAFKQSEYETTGKVWSDVGHTDKCYYVGYCRAGELATMAVTQAGEYYNLNVPLTAGYMLGTNWATCH